MKRAVVILTLAALASACIVERTTHTLYLEGDRSVTWTVLEQDVHSDRHSLVDRMPEEQRFLDSIAAAEHPMALALSSLGGFDASTTVMRDRRPFEVRTSASFPSLEALARALLDGFGIPGTVAVTVNDAVWTLRLELRVDEITEGDDDQQELIVLVEDAEAYRLVAATARFVDARGFAVEDDGRSVRFDLPDAGELAAWGGVLDLSVCWVEGG